MKTNVVYPAKCQGCYVVFYTLDGFDKSYPVVGEFLRPTTAPNVYTSTPSKWNMEGKHFSSYSYSCLEEFSIFDFDPNMLLDNSCLKINRNTLY